jgi:hypothetical protein
MLIVPASFLRDEHSASFSNVQPTRRNASLLGKIPLFNVIKPLL